MYQPPFFPRLQTLTLSLLTIAITCSNLWAADTKPEGSRPNIIIIMTDDMGYSDLGCYGGEIETPNLDGLAANGLRFTQFYNTGRCCPSRASLLTGLYAHQAGVGGMMRDEGPKRPGYRGRLMDRCVTIPEVLTPSGYLTIQTGKWHLGKQKAQWPTRRGFDRCFGSPAGGGFYFRPSAFDQPRFIVRGEEIVYNMKIDPPKDWYSTDAYTDEGLAYVREAVESKKPFFWYLAYNAPHWPLKAKPSDIAKYRGKYKAGWDVLRKQRYQRQIDMGLVDANWKLSPRYRNVPAWDSLSDAKKDATDLRMATYAGMVDCIDQNIGKIIRDLRALRVFDNTLILFLHDNGADKSGGALGLNKGKGVCGTAESYAFAGECWANLSNTPFREFKSRNHEGGIATPLIAHWPRGIHDDQNGTLVKEPAHLIDLMATCVDVTQAAYPKNHNGQAILPMEGKSLKSAFQGQRLSRETPLFFEHQGNKGIRQGRWKLVSMKGGSWELYDMQSDRTEGNDLSTEYPERVKEMKAQWDTWAERCWVTKTNHTTPVKKVRNTVPVKKQVVIRKPGEQLRAHGSASKHAFTQLPEAWMELPSVTIPRGGKGMPTPGFRFKISSSALIYLTVHNRGQYRPPATWQKTDMTLTWSGTQTDTVYQKGFEAGVVEIPGHNGKEGSSYGVPHIGFVKGAGVEISNETP